MPATPFGELQQFNVAYQKFEDELITTEKHQT